MVLQDAIQKVKDFLTENEGMRGIEEITINRLPDSSGIEYTIFEVKSVYSYVDKSCLQDIGNEFKLYPCKYLTLDDLLGNDLKVFVKYEENEGETKFKEFV